ncbi:related to myo-inositol transport protein ITR1 [Serendipita indica DSM 11827]|uniref:Related to myo-inositol transport protein ITR1 n=1 Tax=Serendipita indica (strain DSM 11827) TaxID=1109443 RepID=G4T9F4_SERID|nr:related to myo-inositol transport protein ITR1 [Serendipita indica DSM 11827]
MSDPARVSSNEKTEKGEYIHDDNLSSTVARTTSDGHHSPNEKGKLAQHDELDEKARHLQLVNAKLANLLMGKSKAEIIADVNEWTKEHGMEDLVETFRKGALVAANPAGFEELDELSEEDKTNLRRETTHKWSQPKELYYMADFISPPDLCCALIGCWLTDPLNRRFGRRGTIFITGLLSALTCFWSGLTNNWYHLFIARFFLGFGIGPKSTTVPVYTAECAPPNIRGALVMQWQTWTAFGIFAGFAADLALYHVPDQSGITGLNWRLMLGSAGVPAIFVCTNIFFCPESPRWLIGKGRVLEGYKSLARLRNSPLQAARDTYYIQKQLEMESQVAIRGRFRFFELFTVPRNRRATLASASLTYLQQMCGINIIAYYSATIFEESGFSTISALSASLGFGALNWIFAAPAIFTIDTFGRRALLLTTFPLMSLFLFVTGFAFWIPDRETRVAIVALGVYLMTIAYSPGEGPVPFTYSAEAFPLYVRELGMSLAIAITWFFNFVVSITFPRLLGAFKPQGAVSWYAGWNAIGFFIILLFVPETKALSLEELDAVFSVSTRRHAMYQLRQVPIFIRKHILRQKNVQEQPPLYEEVSNENKTFAPTAAAA